MSSAFSVGMGLFGGSKSANAAAAAAEAQNRAIRAKYQYDLDVWDMKKQQLQAERLEAVDNIMNEARNAGKERAYTDAANQRRYEHDLQIRNREQDGLEAAFERSEDVYYQTTDMNATSAKAAMDSEVIKLQESEDSASFDRNAAYLEMIENEGKLRARSGVGRSAAKGYQVNMSDYGRQMEMLNASLDSTSRNTRAVLDEIIRDKSSADLSAYASKMLDPGVLPDVVKVDAVPVPDFVLPRVLQDYDFGPQPIMGALQDPNAARSAAWGNTLTNIAGSVGDFAGATTDSWNDRKG